METLTTQHRIPSDIMSRLRRRPGRKPAGFMAARREELLDAAGALFIQNGYERTSIDAIVELGGGSKATLYKFFGNKEGMLASLVHRVSDRLLDSIPDTCHWPIEAEQTLRDFGARYLTFLAEPLVVAIYRMVVGEGFRFPVVARTFMAIGPNRLQERLAVFLQRWVETGGFLCDDPARVAQQYMDMLRGTAHLELLLGLRAVLPPEDVARSVQSALDTLLRGRGAAMTRRPPPPGHGLAAQLPAPAKTAESGRRPAERASRRLVET